jgi:DNA-binding transcriptional LysR family regulator
MNNRFSKMLTHRQIEAFRAVMETGSVTGAARQINITQPSASRLLLDLESSVGYSLFKRESKRLIPTPEARALFEEVERSYVGLNNISQAARDIGNYRRGALHITALPAMALSFLPGIISRFCAEKPDISVSLQINSSERVLHSVATQQFDLGFSENDAAQPSVSSELLLRAALVAALPNDHPLCAKSALTPQDFSGQNFIATTSDTTTSNRVFALFSNENVKLNMRLSTQLSYAAGQLVAQGSGISLIDPVTAAELEKQRLISVRPFRPVLNYRCFVLLPTLRPRSRLSGIFLDLVQSQIAELNMGD